MADDAAFVRWVEAGGFCFADWLNAKMVESFISSLYLARALGVSKPVVNTWRRGAGLPTQANRERIAAFFGIAARRTEPKAVPSKLKPIKLEGIVFR